MPYIREDQALITFTADGRKFGDAWYSYDGGALESDSSKTRPGGMGGEVSVGGPSSRDDITLKIQLSDLVITWHKTLELMVQEDAPASCGITFLDRKKKPFGPTFTPGGTLKSAVLPDLDGGSGDVAFYTVVISADEVAG